MENKKPHILVVGDIMLDNYLWGSCKRISPEAPVQIVDIKKETNVLGGAGNVVNNLVSLNCNVTIMSVVGEDSAAQQLSVMLDELKVNKFLIHDTKRETTQKTRIISANQQVIRYDKESKEDISSKIEKILVYKLFETIDIFDLVIISDYGKGVITKELSHKIIFAASGADIKVLVDPKGDDYSKYIGAYLLTPNKNEAQNATGIKINDDESLYKALHTLQNTASLSVPMITLSEDGIAILNKNNKIIKKPTLAKEVYDVTGAGDAVIASLGYSLANGMDIEESIEFANLAAGVVVSKLGNATATLEEIEAYKRTLQPYKIESNIKSFEEIEQIVTRLKKNNKKIVFTNGCFDIIHSGHISYLEKAKTLGDILIVGLNSDDSVKKLKGSNRPINTQKDRAYILASLKSVDYVVIFNEETPYELIKKIKPDILAKGADYKGKTVVGSDIVAKVKLIEFYKGKSTSNIIKKIRSLRC